MSAFLGKIHYLLYDKILLQEDIYQKIIQISSDNNIAIQPILEDAEKMFGQPVRGKLEDVINHDNIHGSLQELITGVESRQAYVTIKALDMDLNLDLLLTVYHALGEEKGSLISDKYTPYQLYMSIYTHLLDGMPCDRVNVITDHTDDYINWETTRCLHREFWQDQIDIYYDLTDAFIHGFLSRASEDFTFERNGFNKSIKVRG